jgi:hypothetical protein
MPLNGQQPTRSHLLYHFGIFLKKNPLGQKDPFEFPKQSIIMRFENPSNLSREQNAFTSV